MGHPYRGADRLDRDRARGDLDEDDGNGGRCGDDGGAMIEAADKELFPAPTGQRIVATGGAKRNPWR